MFSYTTLFCTINIVLAFNATDFLFRYGYLNQADELALTDVKNAVASFQEFYKLTVDGTLNNETLKLMQKPRCGMADNPSSYILHQYKWNKRDVTWYFVRGNKTVIDIATKVFDVWQGYINLNINYSIEDPDIIISFSDKPTVHKKNNRCMGGVCESSFDGKGGSLAHAFYPTKDNTCIEIHLDASEEWYFGLDDKAGDRTSLFSVLLHEVGHSLGLRHSGDVNAVMSAFYSQYLNLSSDDIISIQSLYGIKSSPSTSTSTNATTIIIPSTTSSTEATSAASNVEDKSHPDLCQVQPNTFLITDTHRMYIFHRGWFWLSTSILEQRYQKPKKILSYIPLNFFSHIYQRADGNVMVLDDNNIVSVVQTPSIRIIGRYTMEQFSIPKGAKINCMFNTYSGKVYIFYDNMYFAEIDECRMKSRYHGIISEKFPGIPGNIDKAFRYINGNLYFFQNTTFYEFNEFTNKLVRAGEFNLNIFGINCKDDNETNKNLLSQIQMLLSKLFSNLFG